MLKMVGNEKEIVSYYKRKLEFSRRLQNKIILQKKL